MTDLRERYASQLDELRANFATGITQSLNWRRQQLDSLERMLEEQEPAIVSALAKDLGKPEQEVFLGELALLFSEIRYARRRLMRWTRPRPVPTPLVGLPGRSWVQPEPLGMVLIIGAWNYPIQLVLSPLIPALAAGNCVVIKPSEIAANCAALMADLLPRYMDTRALAIIEGGVEETTALLDQRFDHVFYTGGAAVGRIVMKAAAEHLTPVTLELGGKSPCVIDRGADLQSAARRIVWGKCLNAGQTCIAPDYVLVAADQHDALIEALRAHLKAMYGEDPLASPDYAKIINRRHFDRLTNYLNEGRVVIVGRVDVDRERIEPTVITDVQADGALMSEEIFGPILPILKVESLGQAIEFIRGRAKPLAAYLFTRSRASEQRFIDQVSTGNLCVNDVIMFMSVPELPFGGVGESGMGQYHGRAGFDRLSHLKSIMRRGRFPETTVRFAPYTSFKLKLLKWLG